MTVKTGYDLAIEVLAESESNLQKLISTLSFDELEDLSYSASVTANTIQNSILMERQRRRQNANLTELQNDV